MVDSIYVKVRFWCNEDSLSKTFRFNVIPCVGDRIDILADYATHGIEIVEREFFLDESGEKATLTVSLKDCGDTSAFIHLEESFVREKLLENGWTRQ